MSKSADAFRTISEVADWLGIPAHVLRFWESKFTQVKPVKRAGGRRYYRPADMQLLGGIRKLLHDDGMTIKGVQKVMRDQGVRHVAGMSPPLDDDLEEAISGIALDVTEVEEPRGTVLSFERAKTEPSANAPAAEDVPKGISPPDPKETVPTAPAIAADIDGETASTDTKEPENAAELSTSKPDIADTTPAETPQPAPAPASAAPAAAPADVPPAPEPPETPAVVDSDTASEAERAGADEAPDTAPSAPQDDTNAPPPPRVAKVTVPEDPTDDTSVPGSVLTALATLDAARLSAQKPALSDLTRRIADLRARMTDGAKSL